MSKIFFRRATKEDTHMADSPSHPNSARSKGFDTRVRYAHQSTTTTPRWVKVSVVIILLLVLLFVILHLTGNGFGDHMHMSIIEHGGQPL